MVIAIENVENGLVARFEATFKLANRLRAD
jgi:hypothetical protein